MTKAPYLTWTSKINPAMGKLKLRSMERTNIFYEEWLHFIVFDAGMPDMIRSLFDINPTSLNKNKVPKKVDVPVETTLINGLFEDSLGVQLKRDFAYTIKIMVWVETEEDADGVVFDFQEEEKGNCFCETIEKK